MGVLPDWESLVEKAFGKGTRIVFPRFFESKKNQVTLLTLSRGTAVFDVIAKCFVWGRCEREFEVLERAHLAGVPVPRPISRFDHVGFLEHIPGPTLKRLSEQSPERLDAVSLGRWLARFHRAMRKDGCDWLRGDCGLGNFIQAADGMVHDIDFEEAGPGDIWDEVAQMAISVLICQPRHPMGILPDLSAVRCLLSAYLEESPSGLSEDSLRSRMEADLETRTHHVPARAGEFREYARPLRREPGLVPREFR